MKKFAEVGCSMFTFDRISTQISSRLSRGGVVGMGWFCGKCDHRVSVRSMSSRVQARLLLLGCGDYSLAPCLRSRLARGGDCDGVRDARDERGRASGHMRLTPPVTSDGAMDKPADSLGNLHTAAKGLCTPHSINVCPLRHGLAGKSGFNYFASLARASSTSISHRTPSGRVLFCVDKTHWNSS